jgi:hypothetical protein
MTPFIVLSQRLYSVRTAKLYNKKEIVSIIEKYSMPGNVVTQPGEYMSRPVGLFYIMLTMDMSQRYKQAIRHHTLKSYVSIPLYRMLNSTSKYKCLHVYHQKET